MTYREIHTFCCGEMVRSTHFSPYNWNPSDYTDSACRRPTIKIIRLITVWFCIIARYTAVKLHPSIRLQDRPPNPSNRRIIANLFILDFRLRCKNQSAVSSRHNAHNLAPNFALNSKWCSLLSGKKSVTYSFEYNSLLAYWERRVGSCNAYLRVIHFFQKA